MAWYEITKEEYDETADQGLSTGIFSWACPITRQRYCGYQSSEIFNIDSTATYIYCNSTRSYYEGNAAPVVVWETRVAKPFEVFTAALKDLNESNVAESIRYQIEQLEPHERALIHWMVKEGGCYNNYELALDTYESQDAHVVGGAEKDVLVAMREDWIESQINSEQLVRDSDAHKMLDAKLTVEEWCDWVGAGIKMEVDIDGNTFCIV